MLDSSSTVNRQLIELTTLSGDLIELIVVYVGHSRGDLKNLPIGVFTIMLHMKIVPDAKISRVSFYHRSKVIVKVERRNNATMFTFTFVKNNKPVTLQDGWLYDGELTFNSGSSKHPCIKVFLLKY